MRLDIIIPKNNEVELYEELLRMNKVPVFLYSNLNYSQLSLQLKRLEGFKKGTYKTAYLFKPESAEELVLDKKIRKAVDYIVGTAQDLKLLRVLIEKGRINFFVNIETASGRDHTHYRRSNFNQVLARICKENNVGYLIDFSRIRNMVSMEKRATLIGRISQNTKFCRKFNVQVNVMSFASNVEDIINNDILESFEKIL